MTCRVRQEANIDGSCSWSATVNGQVELRWIALDMPDDGIDLVSVSATDVSDSTLRDATEQLMPLVLSAAKDANKSRVHCLVSHCSPSLFGTSLNDFGFRPAVELQGWMLRSGVSGDSDPDIRIQPWPVAKTELGRDVVTSLVEGCLKNSLDLSGMDTPTAEQLLSNWDRLSDLTSCVLMEQGRPIGFTLVCMETGSHVATLEYLGVIDSSRRQGAGQRVLDQTCQLVMTPEACAEGRQLMVYCDTRNTPAISLYHKTGFTLEDTHTLWVRSERSS